MPGRLLTVTGALLLTSPPPSSAPDIEQVRIVSVFKNACEIGSVKLGASEATPVPAQELPPSISNWYAGVASLSVYRIRVRQPSYLITFVGGDRSPFKNGCALVTRLNSAQELWASITGQQISGKQGRSTQTAFKFSRIDEGYELSVREIGDNFRAAQVSHFTDDRIAQLRSSRQRLMVRPGSEAYFGEYHTLCPTPDPSGGNGWDDLPSPPDEDTSALVQSFLTSADDGIDHSQTLDRRRLRSATISSCHRAAVKLNATKQCKPLPLHVLGDREIRETWSCDGVDAYNMFFTVKNGKIVNIWAIDRFHKSGGQAPADPR